MSAPQQQTELALLQLRLHGEVMEDGILRFRGMLSLRWRGEVHDQLEGGRAAMRLARGAHDEFLCVAIEIAFEQRRGIERVEELVQRAEFELIRGLRSACADFAFRPRSGIAVSMEPQNARDLPMKNPFARLPFAAAWPLLVLVTVLPAALGQAAATRPPNVVVFLADDAGWGDYGINGNAFAATPNIDSLGRDGAQFERFFVCAVCAPTRAEFLTGRYHPRGGVRGVSSGLERLNTDEKTLADAFKARGYATGAFGKWHNGSQWPYHPKARGFDDYYGHTSGHWGEYFDPEIEDNGRMIRDRGYIVDLCTERALAFIGKHQARPFFCFVPFTTPHSPWAAPEKNWQRFKDRAITQPATDPSLEKPDETRCALAMLENQDENVGRILRRLDELGLRENTIVLYFSDNGPNSWRWNGGMKGRKGSVDEGGIRSPLLIRWPGKIEPGTVVRDIAGAIDLLPTLAALTGVPPLGDKPLDGIDLSPALLGRTARLPERMLFTHHNGQITVRTSRHRLDPRGALYDMVADPGQTTDVADRQPEIAERLRAAVAAWRHEVLGPTAAAALAGAAGEPKGKAKKAAGYVIPDTRGFTVGYPEFPWTPLPARDGVPHGTVKRSSSAPNSSYFVNWTAKEDRLTWDIEVHTSGTYDVVIDYTCPVPAAGSRVELSFLGNRLTGKVAPGWDPPLYQNQDTLPRPPAESPLKEFRPLALGRIQLERGRGLLTLRALEIPGGYVMDVRRVNLTLKP
jgi:arylsulfatase A-like enzyme